MRFTRPVGPVAVSATSGVDELPDGTVRMYGAAIELLPDPTSYVRAAGAGIIAPSFFRDGFPLDGPLPMIRADEYACVTNASGYLTVGAGAVPHGGTAPPVVAQAQQTEASDFGGGWFTLVLGTIGATRFQVRAWDPVAGAWLAGGINVTVRTMAVWP